MAFLCFSPGHMHGVTRFELIKHGRLSSSAKQINGVCSASAAHDFIISLGRPTNDTRQTGRLPLMLRVELIPTQESVPLS